MLVYPNLIAHVKSIEVELSCAEGHHEISPYRVLPDFSVVIGFQYRGSLYMLEKDKNRQLTISGISGLQTQHRVFQPADSQTRTILVKLYPWAVNAFFNEDAYHFTNQALGLSEIVENSLISRLEEQLAITTDPERLSHLVQTFLIDILRLNQKNLPPQHILALAKQLSNFSNIDSIEQLAKNYGVSQRNLERQFKSILGLSPKKFLRLSQFQKTLYYLRNGVHWDQIIGQLNYYDQSHFINSFKEFSGFVPGQFKSSIIE